MKPIFLLSVSRSGSTFVQRLIGAQPNVHTISEPWLLLPLAYSLRADGVYAEYRHDLLACAIEDVCDHFPNGRDDYLGAVRDWYLNLCQRTTHAEPQFFLDKSPPYSFVVHEIMEIFEDAKFVFLWRHPIDVLASMVATWGPWRPTLMRSELFIGWPRLISAWKSHSVDAIAVKYEDLTDSHQGRHHFERLMQFLELDREPSSLTRLTDLKLAGRMGDPGATRSTPIHPSRDWQHHLGNPIRREWVRRYIHFLGPDRLELLGYSFSMALEELDAAPISAKSAAGDFGRLIRDFALEPVRVRTHRGRIGAGSEIRALLK